MRQIQGRNPTLAMAFSVVLALTPQIEPSLMFPAVIGTRVSDFTAADGNSPDGDQKSARAVVDGSKGPAPPEQTYPQAPPPQISAQFEQQQAPTVVLTPDGLHGLGRWLSLSSNLDLGYRNTQFYKFRFNTSLFQWDIRGELWFPPNTTAHRWGSYVRVAGIAGSGAPVQIPGSGSPGFQNGWLGGPGAGLQAYPFPGFLGPVRVFGEYNFTHFWGEDFFGQGTSWRPRHQVRTGLDYWKAKHVNDTSHYWWLEAWNGLFWQSANEFTKHYDSPLFANSFRFGLRKASRTNGGALSIISPYVAAQSSLSKYRRIGTAGCHLNGDQDIEGQPNPNPCDFYWENGFTAGGGLRIAPPLCKGQCDPQPAGTCKFLNRLVIYGEYLRTTNYYGPAAPPSVPRFDVRAGVSASVCGWYK